MKIVLKIIIKVMIKEKGRVRYKGDDLTWKKNCNFDEKRIISEENENEKENQMQQNIKKKYVKIINKIIGEPSDIKKEEKPKKSSTTNEGNFIEKFLYFF